MALFNFRIMEKQRRIIRTPSNGQNIQAKRRIAIILSIYAESMETCSNAL